MPARPLRLIALVLAGAALIALAWLLAARVLDRPKATDFGGEVVLETLAGDGERGFADGAGAAARFSDPFALAVGPKGEVYVADAGETDRVRRIAANGETTTLPGAFATPSGLAVDRAGNIYVAETGANRIRRIGRHGSVVTVAGDGTAGFRDGAAGQARFNGPIGVAVGPAGEIYVADTYNDRIRLITPDGQVKTLAGGEAPGFADGRGVAAAFDTPCALALGQDGVLYIADAGNDAVRRLAPDGAVTTLAQAKADDPSPPLRSPMGLAATADGYVYVSSFTSRGRILQISPAGEMRVLTGPDAWASGNRSLRLVRPAGLALDRHGILYVAEAARYAVRTVRPRGASDRTPSPSEELAPGPPALARAASVPWPVAPQDAWHEVVGTMGEVRGDYKGETRDHLHAGLDVRAGVGATVLAVKDERVESPLAVSNLGRRSEGLRIDELTYIHMRVGRTSTGAPLDAARFQLAHDAEGKLAAVRIKRGTLFRAGDALGTVNGMAHVHLELGARGGHANPLILRFPGMADHFAPRVSAIEVLDASGRRLTERRQGRLLVPRDAGPVSIVAEAWDQMDGNAARRRLGLYRVGFQILTGNGAPAAGYERPRINLEFDRLPADRDAAKIAYAPTSGDAVHSGQPTVFAYVVTNRLRAGQAKIGGWRPADLPPGDYVIRIFAADYAGNTAIEGRDLPITVE